MISYDITVYYYFCDQWAGFGGGAGGFKGNGGGGGYTGGIGGGHHQNGIYPSGGGGGSFLADPNGTRQLNWYDAGNCSIEYIGRGFVLPFP